MGYRRLKGIPGLVYVPEHDEHGARHNCKDCFSCQWCSETRCRSCLKSRTINRKK